MVLEKLGESLKGTLQKITQSMFVDEKLINELIKDIQRALLGSDVNVKLVFELTQKIRQRALKETPPGGLTKKEHLLTIVYEELVLFVGGKQEKIEIAKKPFKIMLLGLFGSGKTTTSGKLARYYTKRGYKVALFGLDIHRPAAMEQLEQVGKNAGVAVYSDKKNKDPLALCKKYIPEFEKYDIAIIDTAGRDALSDDLIAEIESVNAAIEPDMNLLVLSGDIGQAAQKQAAQFHASCGIKGVILTKMDGTAKGGGALSACVISGAPIRFIGVGEKVDDLEQFNPEGFISRLLGMGDMEALIEKAQGVMTQEQAEDLGARFLSGEFNLLDLYEQMEALKKMGPLTKVMEMIPGMGSLKLPKDMLEVQQEKLEKWRYAMNSMTKAELEDPEIIDPSRVERIAKGSGIPVPDVRELIKQYRQSKKLVKMFKGNKGDLNKMLKKIGGRLPMGG